MTILVTGATGFLGLRLVEQLCVSGTARVRCFIRPNSDSAELDKLREKYPSTALQYVMGNLLSLTDAQRATEGVEVIYHLAADMRGTAPAVFANTVIASKNVLEGIVKHGVRRVVLVSSISVYGLAHLPRNTVVTEEFEIEKKPEKRDVYTFAKVRQEQLFEQYRRNHAFEFVVLRPGAIYGEGAATLPSRAGLRIGPVVLQIAAGSRLPLTYVNNCARAVALAVSRGGLPEGSYNVVDDDLPTAAEYLRLYRSLVENITCVRLPFYSVLLLSHLLDRYRVYSKGQIPAVLTPYQVESTWAGCTFSNEKLKNAGWRPSVSTAEGLLRAYQTLICPRQSRTLRRAHLIGRTPPLASTEN